MTGMRRDAAIVRAAGLLAGPVVDPPYSQLYLSSELAKAP